MSDRVADRLEQGHTQFKVHLLGSPGERDRALEGKVRFAAHAADWLVDHSRPSYRQGRELQEEPKREVPAQVTRSENE